MCIADLLATSFYDCNHCFLRITTWATDKNSSIKAYG